MKKILSLIFAICLLVTCAFSLTACTETKDPDQPPENPPPAHSHEFTLNTYAIADAKAYKVKMCDCGEYDIEQEIVGAIIVSAGQDLALAIKNASANSTIVLGSGEYPKLTLSGKDSFPQNLTIIGTENVVINGLSITSGVKYEDTLSTQDQNQLDQAMVNAATLNGNLTFKNLTFGRTVAIRNAGIDGFALYDCEFKTWAGLVINSNVFYDYYGCDSDFAQNTSMKRKAWCYLYTKNLVVENCTFHDVDYTGNQDTAILLHSIENITIKNCVVDKSGFNAVQINGVTIAPTKGTILLESNTFKNTLDRLLRFNCIEEGSIVTLKNNTLLNSDTNGDSDGEIMKASSVSGVEFVFEGNTYYGDPIDKDSYGVVGIPQ